MKAWRKLAGPTNSKEAQESDPSSLRALYGTDGTKNAVHGSDSFSSAFREINFCFPSARSAKDENRHNGCQSGVFAPEERTVALLKPGVSEVHSGKRTPAFGSTDRILRLI